MPRPPIELHDGRRAVWRGEHLRRVAHGGATRHHDLLYGPQLPREIWPTPWHNSHDATLYWLRPEQGEVRVRVRAAG